MVQEIVNVDDQSERRPPRDNVPNERAFLIRTCFEIYPVDESNESLVNALTRERVNTRPR